MNYSNIGAYNNIVFSFLNEQMDVLNPTPQEKKFIDLLSEYRLEYVKKNAHNADFTLELADGKKCLWVHETVIISKNFKFIEWLLKNDKIDCNKLYFGEFIPYFKDNYDSYEQYEILNGLLMILQIQDDPINFLIQCLK